MGIKIKVFNLFIFGEVVSRSCAVGYCAMFAQPENSVVVNYLEEKKNHFDEKKRQMLKRGFEKVKRPRGSASP